MEADVVAERLKLPPAVQQITHALADERVGAVADNPEMLQRREQHEVWRPAASLVVCLPARVDLVDLEDNATGDLADRERVAVVAVGRLERKACRDKKRAI